MLRRSDRDTRKLRTKKIRKSLGRLSTLERWMRHSTLEFLEARQMLAVTAIIDGGNDAIITGTAAADLVTMSIENPGMANETLRISDPGGVTAGAGFTQDGANSATVLTSAITGADIFISTLDGGDTINIQATPAGILTHIDEGAGAGNVINVSSNAPANTGNLDGLNGILRLDSPVPTPFRTLNISASGSAAADTVTIDTVATNAFSGTAGGGWTIQEVNFGSNLVNLSLGSGNDQVNVVSHLMGETVNINTGGGADTVAFADGVNLQGGTVNGGADADTLDYSAYMTSVAANLGLGVTGLSATLGGDQENPPQATPATGTATISNYDPINKTFDISITVTDLAPALVTGFHIHRAPFGVNGPIIIDFAPGGVPIAPLTPTGTGFTFNATGLSIAASALGGVVNEASFLGGATYVNIHTAAAPAGLIRGQLFSTGNVNVANGTATGTGGVTGVENVIGGAAMDGLIGNSGANNLSGNGGNDTIVGAPGADTMSGGPDNDVLIWSNGDGSDVMDGDAGTDIVQVNGNVGAPDAFTVAANGARIDFDRTSAGPFSLDIGSTETLTPIGIGGDDTFTVGNLVGVANLANVHLAGLGGADAFTVTPSTTVQFLVTGSAPATNPGDSLTVDLAGTTGANPSGVPDGSVTFTSGHTAINYRGIEDINAENGVFPMITVNAGAGNNAVRAFRDGVDLVVTVDGVEAYRGDFADVNALVVNGQGGDDAFEVDFSAGDVAPPGGISFVGGETGETNGDEIEITGYSLLTADGVADVTVNHTGPESGNVVLAGLGTIAFSETEPLVLAGNAADLVINLPAGADPTVVLSDDGGAADPDATQDPGFSAIDGAFEYTEFANPTNTLTINDGTGLKSIAVQGLDGAFDADVTIDDQDALENNVVTFQTNATSVGAGVLVVDAATINVNQSISTTSNASPAVNFTANANIAFGGGTITANAGRVTLTAETGAITDSNATIDVSAADLILVAATGIGVAANPLETSVDRADVTNTTAGGIFITNTGALELIDLGGPNANAVSGVGGNGEIRASSPLTIASNAITAGGMTYTAADSAAAGDDLTVNAGVVVQDTTAALTMNGGDNVVFNTGSTVRASAVLTINGDFGNADAGVGSTMNLFGTIRSDTAGIVVNGAADDDIITVDDNGAAAGGTVSSVITSAGNGLAVNGGGGNDTLTLQDFSDATPDTFTITDTTISEAPGDNYFDGMSPGDGLTFASLETLNIQTSNIVTVDGSQGDVVTVLSLNAATTYNLDGNDPTLLPGDILNITPAGSVTVYEQGGFYQFEFTGSDNLNVQEFETINITPGNGVLNIVGDEGQGTTNGGAGVDEADLVVVTGTGPNEGRLQLGHNGVLIAVPPQVSFFNVTDLNITTFDLNDTITVSPFATAIEPWDIEVDVDAGAGTDRLIYNNVATVFDDTRVVATGLGAGRIDAPGIGSATTNEVVTFVGVEDVNANANPGDDDSLTLELTGGDDTATFLFDPDAGDDDIQLTGLFDIVVDTDNYDSLTVNGNEGDDTFIINLVGAGGAAAGALPLELTINGGPPHASDLIIMQGNAGLPDDYTVNPGADNQSGTVEVAGTDMAEVSFTGIENIQVNGQGGAGVDRLFVNGNGDANSFTLLAGEVQTDITPNIAFTGFGTTAPPAGQFNINFNGMGGDDQFAVNPQATLTVSVIGGESTTGDELIVNGTAAGETIAVDYDATASTGTITVGALAPVTFDNTIESLVVDGLGGGDTLTVVDDVGGAANDVFTLTPGATADSGVLQVNARQSLRFENLGVAGAVTLMGGGGTDTFVYNGTPADDSFNVLMTGAVDLVSGGVNHVDVTPTDVENLVLNGLGGENIFNVPGDHPFDSVVIGGGAGAAGNTLNFTGAGGDVTVNLTDKTITETGFGPVSYAGAENVNIDVNGDLIVEGTDDNDHFIVTPLNADNDGRFTHDGTPGVNFSYDDATTITFNGGGGTADVLEIHGDAVDDVITSTATTVTVDGSVVTLGTGLEAVTLSTFGGDDDIDASALTLPLTILAGDGDDMVVGGTAADFIRGGAGDDILIGGGGADEVYGDEGNDLFGNATEDADGMANDPGADRFYGGDGSDAFVWEPGDGSDVFEGGAGEADRLIFFGSGGAEIFNVFASLTDPSRAILFRDAGNITIDMAGVDQIDVNGQGGADRFVIGRANDGDDGAVDAPTSPYTDPTASLSPLNTTEVRVVNVDAGMADGAADNVFVDGLALDDELLVSLESAATGVVRVSGLPYDVRIRNSVLADGDRLTVRGNEGDDVIKSVNPTGAGALNVETVIGITLAGGAGDDELSADAILIGGVGDDFLEGGAGDDMLFGNQGEDTMIGGGGNDTYDGGADFDTILIRGTADADSIDVVQDNATTLRYAIAGVVGVAATETDTLVADTVEEARIEAGAGADTIRVAHADALVATPGVTLRYTVVGGPGGVLDRLGVVDDGVGDVVIQRLGADHRSGSVSVGPLAPVFYEDVEFVQIVPLDPLTGGTGAGGGGRLLVFKHDAYESNNSRQNAYFLGAGETINVDPTIDPGADGVFNNLPGDEDWYRFVAQKTGTLDFQVYFTQVPTLANGRAGLPGNGDLNIEVRDADGDLITGFGANDATNDERVRIPAVQGQTYYLRVLGASPAAINQYAMTIINEAPPTPFDLELADNLTILTGAQENPDVNTIATGIANFQFDPATMTFDLDVFVSGIELEDNTPLPQLTDSHIHVAPVGVNGPVIVPFGVAPWVQESGGIRLRLTDRPFPAANLADLLAGNTYINVHTTANLTGEIRGQILIPNVLGVSDTGRSQFDDVTRDNTPTIFLRLDDATLLNDLPGNAAGVPGAPAPDETIPIPFNESTAASPDGLTPGFRVAIFDESDTHNPVMLGFAQPVENLNGVYSFTFSTPLADGSHFITARVQMIDPADNNAGAPVLRATGFGPRSESLEIVVDTTPPPVFFGDPSTDSDGLTPDPTVTPQQPPVIDNKTNDSTPEFWGVAEANAVIRVYADLTPDDDVDNFDVLLGMTVAIPLDGTNQFPNGQWRLSSNIDLNDPSFFPEANGLRRILVTAEDLAGNVSPAGLAAPALEIFIDTQGPQVTGVFIGQTDLIGLTNANTLIRFNTANPGVILATVPITGLAAGETVVGIDYRPSTNPANVRLYGVVNGPAAADRIVTINPITGAITSSVALSVGLNGTVFGVDFNPVADRLRIVSDAEQNLRVNVANGMATIDGALNPAGNIAGAAYTNNLGGAASTTLYNIDFGSDMLVRQDPPNAGTLVAVGPLGLNVADGNVGFEIAPGTNVAYAVFNAGLGQTLYTINLTTGAATPVNPLAAAVGAPLIGLTAVPAFDLFDPKPVLTPTPLIDKLVIRVQDLPARLMEFQNPAINDPSGTNIPVPQNIPVPINAGFFSVIGDSNGIIPIMSATFTPDAFVAGQPATGSLTLMFFEPLPDDRFTLLVRDALVDDVGNALDGESNAGEPQNNPLFPSGDGQPGGDFTARFTVDSRPEVAVYSGRTIVVDTNGNGVFDPRNDKDFTDRDVVYMFGFITDDLFVGNFAALVDNPATPNIDERAADGFDKLAAYGNIGGAFRFLIDNNNDGVPDLIDNNGDGVHDNNSAAINGVPVAGNFDGNQANGDEVGLFDGTTWYLDANHNFNVDPNAEVGGVGVGDLRIVGAIRGAPIVGDFNGDGFEDLATYNDFRGRFEIDLATGPGLGYGNIDVILLFAFPGTNERPVAADVNGDGFDDLGLFVPQQGAVTPAEQAIFHILVSRDPGVGPGAGVSLPLWQSNRAEPIATPADLAAAPGIGSFVIHFRPEPFGEDLLLPFGENFALPLLGNFDPPVTATIGAFVNPVGGDQYDTNPENNLDVNADGVVNAADLLELIDDHRLNGPHTASNDGEKPFLDVDGNGTVNLADVLPIVAFLREQALTGAGGEGEGDFTSPQFVGVLSQPTNANDAADASIAAERGELISDASLDDVAADVASVSGAPALAIDLSEDEDYEELEDAIQAIVDDLID